MPRLPVTDERKGNTVFILYTVSAEEVKNRDRLADEYISRMAEGDASAMGDLYELIKTDVYAYACSKLGRTPEAEDITHDTFVQIYQNAALYTSHGKPLAWVFTVELNLIRRLKQKERNDIPLDELIESGEEGESLERSVESVFVEQLLSKLGEDEREIVILHDVSGLKHREIAKLLSLPLSTVLSRYNRAIKKLQAIAMEEVN